MGKGWRTPLLSGYALVVVLLATVWTFSLLGPVSQAMEERHYEGLLSVANATDIALSTSELPADEVLERIASSDKLRLTLISDTGDVLAESSDTGGLANHASRPEVITALEGSTGYDRRVSATDGVEYLYVAIPSHAREGGAVLRVSMPITQAHEALSRLRWTSFALLAAAVVLAVGMSWFSFARTAIPVSKLERVRTDFVANASHELKTPVAGIRLLTESIRQANQDGDSEMVSEFSQRLERESTRLQSLVTDLMDLSRLEDEGDETVSHDACDLATVVATSFQVHQAKAQDAGLAFTFEDADVGIKGARVGLSITNATLLIDNLIDNAIAYTEKGSVSVTLSTTESHAILVVEDTGIGIPLADQDRIFERFYRVDTARSREAGGTGLGLSLVRHAVKRGNGRIELESTPGVGSKFTVTLPLAR